MTTVIEFINHYQRSINKSLDSEERVSINSNAFLKIMLIKAY